MVKDCLNGVNFPSFVVCRHVVSRLSYFGIREASVQEVKDPSHGPRWIVIILEPGQSVWNLCRIGGYRMVGVRLDERLWNVYKRCPIFNENEGDDVLFIYYKMLIEHLSHVRLSSRC